MNQQKFNDLVQAALIDNHKTKSVEALNQLYKLKVNNVGQALRFCSKLITNVEVTQQMRVVALQLLVNYIRHSNYKCPPYRLVMDDNIQYKIRASCKFLSIDYVKEVTSFISQIFFDNSYEVPILLQDQIMNQFIQMYKDESEQLNRFTIIHISERLVLSSNTNKLTYDELNTLFTKLCCALKKPIQRINYVVSTLKESLSLAFQHFDDTNLKNLIWSYFTDILITNNVQLRETLLRTIMHFWGLTSAEQARDYISQLHQISLQLFSSTNILAVAAIDVWIYFGNEITMNEKGLQKQNINVIKELSTFISKHFSKFLTVIFQNFVETESITFENGQLSGSSFKFSSSYNLLTLIFHIASKDCHKVLSNFLNSNLNDQQNHNKLASCMALAALAESTSKDSVRLFLQDNIYRIVEKIQDPTFKTTRSALYCILKVSQNYQIVLVNNPKSGEILQILLNSLSFPLTYLYEALEIMNNITGLFNKFRKTTFYKNRHSIMQAAAKVTLRQDLREAPPDQIADLADTAYQIMVNIVLTELESNRLRAYLHQFMFQLYQTLHKQEAFVQVQQSALSNCIHGCLSSLDGNKLLQEEADEIVAVLISGWLNSKSDMFYIFGGLAQCLGTKFLQYTQICLNQISTAIQDESDLESFKAGLDCLNDISRFLQYEFNPYANIVLYLRDLLLNPNCQLSLKPTIYNAMSSVVAATGQTTIGYLNDYKKLLDLGTTECLKLYNQLQSIQMDFEERYTDSILYLYQSMIQRFCDTINGNPDMEDTIFPMFRFMRVICDQKYRPKLLIQKQVITIIMHVANYFHSCDKAQSIILPFITNKFVLELVFALSKHKDDEGAQDDVEYACEILSTLYHFKLKI